MLRSQLHRRVSEHSVANGHRCNDVSPWTFSQFPITHSLQSVPWLIVGGKDDLSRLASTQDHRRGSVSSPSQAPRKRWWGFTKGNPSKNVCPVRLLNNLRGNGCANTQAFSAKSTETIILIIKTFENSLAEAHCTQQCSNADLFGLSWLESASSSLGFGHADLPRQIATRWIRFHPP